MDPMCTEEDQTVRQVLLRESCCPYEVAFDLVYCKPFGFPSGAFWTAVINCMTNYQLGASCFIDLKLGGYSEWDVIRKKFYGDDNLYTYPVQYANIWSGKVMEDYFKTKGLVYTPASKDGVWKQLPPLYLEYLKRKTIHVEGYYFPIIAKPSIDETINWIAVRGNINDEYLILAANVASVMDHLVFYGREEYNRYRRAILDHVPIGALDRFCYIPTFEEKVHSLIKEGHFPSGLRETRWYREGSFEVNQSEVVETKEAEMFKSSGGTITSNTGVVVATSSLGARSKPVVKVADNKSDYSSIVGRWNVLPSLSWTLADTAGALLSVINLPMEGINNDQVRNVFESNGAVRTDVEIMVKLGGTRYHQGLLMVGFVPGITKDQFTYRCANNKVTLSNLHNKYFLNANAGESLIVRCPYFSKTDYIRSNKTHADAIEGSIGVFFVACFTPLQGASEATSSIPVILSVRFVDSEFHFPIPRESLQGFFEDLESVAKKTTSKIVNVGDGIVKLIGVAKDGLDVISNMDHGPVPLVPVPMRVTNGSVNNVDVPFVSEVLSVYSSGMAGSEPGHFARQEDEMNLPFLMGKKCYLTTLEWDTTNIYGTQLFSSPILPSQRIAKFTNTDVSNWHTSIDWLSMMFGRWRGDLCIEIVLSATTFATGTLRVSSLSGFFGDTIDIADSTSQAFTTLDLAEGKRAYTIKFPYNGTQPTKRILPGLWSSVVGDWAREQYACGTWFLHVENPLTLGGDIPDNVTIEVFYWMENVSLYDSPPVVWNFEVVAPALLMENNQGEIVVSTGVETREAVIDNTVPISSLRDLGRKFGYVDGFSITAPTRKYLHQVSEWYELRTLGAITQCYAGYRGGVYVRARVLSHTVSGATLPFFLVWDPNPGSSGDWSTSTGMTYSSANACTAAADTTVIAVTVPFNYNNNFISTRGAIGNNSGVTSPQVDLNMGYVVAVNSTGNMTYALSVSGGDDFRCAGWIGPPKGSLLNRG
jgi:hypothetical protein